jgi:hypothetical protein
MGRSLKATLFRSTSVRTSSQVRPPIFVIEVADAHKVVSNHKHLHAGAHWTRIQASGHLQSCFCSTHGSASSWPRLHEVSRLTQSPLGLCCARPSCVSSLGGALTMHASCVIVESGLPCNGAANRPRESQLRHTIATRAASHDLLQSLENQRTAKLQRMANLSSSVA